MRVALVVPVCPKRRILQGLSDWQHAPSDEYTRAVLYLFLFILHRRDAKDHQDLLRILVEDHTHNREIVDMAESIIQISEQRGHQQGVQQGERQGRQQGLEQGEIHGKQEALLKLLRHRFPSVPDAVITRVRSLRSAVELDALFDKGLTAKSLEELQ